MEEQAKVATPEELLIIAELADEAVREQIDGRGGYIWSRRETSTVPYVLSLEASMASPDEEIWVGTLDGAVLSYARAKVEVLRTGEYLGLVTDIYVTPEARSVGLGEALINVIIAWCSERKCVGIDSMALPGNRETKNFFETFGFKARLLTVHRSL
ncbi:MAG: GNAT family N-acetyltransferase [Actinomycetota bacterium]|nr:GNAT family N-acetyltransferase [Actinomycetota bacterium]MDG2119946.1 GNAT family N-acetyltransferase [Actinomycetota bacterium]